MPHFTTTMNNNIPRPSERLDKINNNVWIWIQAISAASPAQPLLDLGVGLMEHNPPAYVRDAYRESLSRVEINQYGPNGGFPQLKQALADVYSPFYKRQLNPDTELSIHTGGNQSLLCCMMAFLDRDDEVILMEPAFSIYELHANFIGAKPVYVPLRAPSQEKGITDSNEWKLDMEEFRSAFTSRTKMVVINTPHNPLGKIFSEDELHAIGSVCIEKGVIIISDEVYERTNFSSDSIPRTGTISSEIGKRTLTVGSAGKVFNATGWRLGWVIGDANLISAVKTAHFAISYVPPGPPQVATEVGFRRAEEMDFWRTNKLEMQERMDTLCRILDDIGLTYSKPHAAYFVLVSTDRLKVPKDVDFPDDVREMSPDRQVCWWLINKFGIVTIPGGAFYCDQHATLASKVLRMVACKSPEKLETARERLLQLRTFVVRN